MPPQSNHTASNALRPGAALAVVGVVITVVASRFHGGTDPADLHTVLPQYATNPNWKAVHLGQFVGLLFIICSLIILLRHLKEHSNSVFAFLGMITATVSAATLAANHAVDGVAIRYVAENWVNAPPDGKLAAMNLAQAVRHIEQGLSALFAFNLGIALLLCSAAILTSRAFPKWLGAAALPVGAVYLVAGVRLYYFGFSRHVLSFWSSVFLLTWSFAAAYVLWQQRS